METNNQIKRTQPPHHRFPRWFWLAFLGLAVIAVVASVLYVTVLAREASRLTGPEGLYEKLAGMCGKDSCCLDSVSSIKTKGYKLAQNGQCPQGQEPNQLLCVGSYVWCQPKPTPSDTYYNQLEKQCGNQVSPGCCQAQVATMRKNSYKLTDNNSCPKGYKVSFMKCIDSYRWCEPVTQGDLLKVCPQEWIVNEMPGPSDKSLPSEYFIYQDSRRELSEFDMDWVKANCKLEPQKVY